MKMIYISNPLEDLRRDVEATHRAVSEKKKRKNEAGETVL